MASGKAQRKQISKPPAHSDDSTFALSSMRRVKNEVHTFAVNFDRLAASFKADEPGKVAEMATNEVSKVASSIYRERFKTWAVANESTTTTYFSAEGDPSWVEVSLNHQLKMLKIQTHNLPEDVFARIKDALVPKNSS